MTKSPAPLTLSAGSAIIALTFFTSLFLLIAAGTGRWIQPARGNAPRTDAFLETLFESCCLSGFIPIRRRAWVGVEKEGMEQEDLKDEFRRLSFRYVGRLACS